MPRLRIDQPARQDQAHTSPPRRAGQAHGAGPAGPPNGAKFPGGEIVRNIEADRLQILFDEKPDEETRAALKQNGFRWSPRYSAWQRQLTPNAEAAARRALGLTE